MLDKDKQRKNIENLSKFASRSLRFARQRAVLSDRLHCVKWTESIHDLESPNKIKRPAAELLHERRPVKRPMPANFQSAVVLSICEAARVFEDSSLPFLEIFFSIFKICLQFAGPIVAECARCERSMLAGRREHRRNLGQTGEPDPNLYPDWIRREKNFEFGAHTNHKTNRTANCTF